MISPLAPHQVPDISHLRQAARLIEGSVRRTPLLEIPSLGFWVKAESLQWGGAFKARGAFSRLLSLSSEERARGVVAFSSGNHAQAVALAAHRLGIEATIVMPEDSQPHKVTATARWGCRIVQQGVTVTNRTQVATALAAEQGSLLVPPYDDPWIVAGQGTVGLEIVEQLAQVQTVVVCLGGGGLLSGVALAVKSLAPAVRVIGVEPAAGDDGRRSLQAGRIVSIAPPTTLADGARTLQVGAIPFEIMRRCVDDIVTVTDAELLHAMGCLAVEAGLVVEPTGALAAAALLGGHVAQPGRAVAVLSGSNVAAELLAQAVLSYRRA
jgi:threo-3-hydroxy-L-aspartate ammonia-lyase